MSSSAKARPAEGPPTSPVSIVTRIGSLIVADWFGHEPDERPSLDVDRSNPAP